MGCCPHWTKYHQLCFPSRGFLNQQGIYIVIRLDRRHLWLRWSQSFPRVPISHVRLGDWGGSYWRQPLRAHRGWNAIHLGRLAVSPRHRFRRRMLGWLFWGLKVTTTPKTLLVVRVLFLKLLRTIFLSSGDLILFDRTGIRLIFIGIICNFRGNLILLFLLFC